MLAPGRKRKPALARRHLYLLLILALAYLLNGLGIWWEPGQPDEIVFRALPRDGLWDWHPHTFKFPSLQLYIIRLGAIMPSLILHRLGLLGEYYWGFALFLGRAITVLMSLGAVLLTYLMGRCLFNTRVGLLAALLLTLCPLFVNDAHFATTDVPSLFWTLAALYAVVRLRAQSSPRSFLLCGVLVGLAVSTKYLGGVVLLVAGAQLLWWTAHGRQNAAQLATRLALLASATIVAFLATSPFIILDARSFLADTLYLRDIRLGAGKSLPLSKTLLLLPRRLHMILSPPWFFLFLFAFVYHLACLKKRRFGRAFPLLIYLILFILLFEVVWSMTYRLHLVFVPVAALLTANFLFHLNFMVRRRRFIRIGLRLLVVALLITLLIRSALVTYYFLNDTRQQAERFILNHTPPGAVFSFPNEFPMYFPRIKLSDRLVPLQLVEPGDESLEHALREAGVTHVILSSLWSFRVTGKEKEFYDDLSAERSRYQQIAEFEREGFLGLKPQAVEFVSPIITIYALPTTSPYR